MYQLLILFIYFFKIKTGFLDEIKSLCLPLKESEIYFTQNLLLLFKNTPKSKMSSGGFGTVVTFPYIKSPLPELKLPLKTAVKIITQPKYKLNKKENIDWNVNKKNKHEIHLKMIHDEIDFLRKTSRTPNLLQMYQCFYDSTKTSDIFFLAMETLVSEMTGDSDLESTPQAGVSKTVLTTFRHNTNLQHIRVYLSLGQQLQQIHDRGYTHNDIKPSNLMFSNQKATQAKIIDFGAINLPGQFMAVRSYPFVDPETVQSNRNSFANDIWALGMSLAEIEVGWSVAQSEEDQPLTWKHYLLNPAKFRKPNQIREALLNELSLIPWTNFYGDYSFAKLIFSMMRIKQRDRIRSMLCVNQWLYVLEQAFLHKWDQYQVEELGTNICREFKRQTDNFCFI